MGNRQERDNRYLEALEEITQKLWSCKEKYNLNEEENHPSMLRLKVLEEKLTTERRLIEEVSLPCRFILEHFTSFMGKSDHTVGFSIGQQLELGRGCINDFSINEWGNVSLVIGNVHLNWRDQDYQYLFILIRLSCVRSTEVSRKYICPLILLLSILKFLTISEMSPPINRHYIAIPIYLRKNKLIIY